MSVPKKTHKFVRLEEEYMYWVSRSKNINQPTTHHSARDHSSSIIVSAKSSHSLLNYYRREAKLSQEIQMRNSSHDESITQSLNNSVSDQQKRQMLGPAYVSFEQTIEQPPIHIPSLIQVYSNPSSMEHLPNAVKEELRKEKIVKKRSCEKRMVSSLETKHQYVSYPTSTKISNRLQIKVRTEPKSVIKAFSTCSGIAKVRHIPCGSMISDVYVLGVLEEKINFMSPPTEQYPNYQNAFIPRVEMCWVLSKGSEVVELNAVDGYYVRIICTKPTVGESVILFKEIMEKGVKSYLNCQTVQQPPISNVRYVLMKSGDAYRGGDMKGKVSGADLGMIKDVEKRKQECHIPVDRSCGIQLERNTRKGHSEVEKRSIVVSQSFEYSSNEKGILTENPETRQPYVKKSSHISLAYQIIHHLLGPISVINKLKVVDCHKTVEHFFKSPIPVQHLSAGFKTSHDDVCDHIESDVIQSLSNETTEIVEKKQSGIPPIENGRKRKIRCTRHVRTIHIERGRNLKAKRSSRSLAERIK